jgi:hypothetical protein
MTTQGPVKCSTGLVGSGGRYAAGRQENAEAVYKSGVPANITKQT